MVEPRAFTAESFRRDLVAAASAVGAPHDPDVASAVYAAFPEPFHTGSVLWRTTGQAGAPLSYRVFPTDSVDTTEQALASGLLRQHHPLLPLARSWAKLYDGKPLHSCSFDADFGLTKTWFYFGTKRPHDEILGAAEVAPALAARIGEFADMGLRHISFAAVDWRSGSVVLDFDVAGPMSPADLNRYVALTGSTAIPAETADTVVRQISRDYCVALAVNATNGVALDVGFSVLDFAACDLPSLPERLARFFGEFPVSPNDFNVLGWEFGRRGSHIKAERQYRGDIRTVLDMWMNATN
ncbi:Aromatic prenyltransferase Orf2 [Actinokineospora alba]|uniref:Aromatic prenyltransferase Orf2 n=1 Tax=Actinokineospora alba TaxID=504798 RepID=A0A1H0L7C3_9PSEU|nr:aromatic prenyltransferase [Actinokineospora alba]TDP67223.1 aromatic prenyltransferase Orf2 [Actinokineospora alba]SDJ03776.1 Aromatic prenyltransferase Orf2 [Actinokineospora alba]SDO63982.1 Aromatic prenyltransferase Orf2 [Actinokineospora alba]